MNSMAAPVAIDIDGTMTRSDGIDAIDPRLFEMIPTWDAPVVIATGWAFPYPVALCYYLGIDELVVAENGGVVYADDRTVIEGDREGARSVLEEFENRGGTTEPGVDSVENRWRETELIVQYSADGELLSQVASEFGMEVYDTGYAYQVTSPAVDKGKGLEVIADMLQIDVEDFIAIGDSENDVSMLSVAGHSFAVNNADERAKAAADTITEGRHMDGLVEALRFAQSED
jgi:hypothetical protein